MPSPLSGPLFKHSPDGTTQLPLFATAGEILHNYKPSELGGVYHNDVDAMLKDKQHNADSEIQIEGDEPGGWYGGLTDSIKEHGYDWSKPIPIWSQGGMMMNGHHRLAVMHRDRPEEYIPLDYDMSEVHQRTHLQNKYDDMVDSMGPDLANIAYKPHEYPYIKRQANKGPIAEEKF